VGDQLHAPMGAILSLSTVPLASSMKETDRGCSICGGRFAEEEEGCFHLGHVQLTSGDSLLGKRGVGRLMAKALSHADAGSTTMEEKCAV